MIVAQDVLGLEVNPFFGGEVARVFCDAPTTQDVRSSPQTMCTPGGLDVSPLSTWPLEQSRAWLTAVRVSLKGQAKPSGFLDGLFRLVYEQLESGHCTLIIDRVSFSNDRVSLSLDPAGGWEVSRLSLTAAGTLSNLNRQLEAYGFSFFDCEGEDEGSFLVTRECVAKSPHSLRSQYLEVLTAFVVIASIQTRTSWRSIQAPRGASRGPGAGRTGRSESASALLGRAARWRRRLRASQALTPRGGGGSPAPAPP